MKTHLRPLAVLICLTASLSIHAQSSFKPLDLNSVQGGMPAKEAAPANGVAALDTAVAQPAESTTPAPRKAAKRPARQGQDAEGVERNGRSESVKPGSQLNSAPTNVTVQTRTNPNIERVVFDRRPVAVALKVGQERIVYLPWEAAINVPEEADARVSVQVIGRTLFLSAQTTLGKVRLTAEGLNGEGFIPLDVTARTTADVPEELEVFLKNSTEIRASKGKSATDDEDEQEPEQKAPDAVQLARFCSQNAYAPLRLIKPLPGVRQIDITPNPVAGLYRGGALMTTPIGAWRSTDTYLTAVRFTNRSATAIELDMDQLRGRWVAAMPQHWRVLPAGDEADTTVVCLLSDQPFDAARP